MPGMLKVGCTMNLSEDRAKALRKTGVPLPFKVEYEALTSFPEETEASAHELLASCRVDPKREFFRTTPSVAIEAVKLALLEAASIDKWNFEGPNRVSDGDRIALPMKQGDIFVILAFPQLLAESSEPVDFWQAHADGDLLELMGVDPEFASGVSDYDTGSEEDPVPFLDRAERRPNGCMNGRERLVPGDRLLWLRPTAEGRVCMMAIFEMATCCQVISRTWEPKVDDQCGLPLLLQDLTVGQLPDSVVLAARAVMRLPMPRTWAPRKPDPDDGWVRTGVRQAPPEYWLTQYAKRRK